MGAPVYVLRSLPVVVAYVSVHLSLVIDMLLRLAGLKECELETQSLGLDWPLSEVGTGWEQHIFYSPHRLIFWACLPGPETENTHTHTGWRPCLGITTTISSSNFIPVGHIVSWVPFVTDPPSRIGRLLRDAIVSSSSCRKVRRIR